MIRLNQIIKIFSGLALCFSMMSCQAQPLNYIELLHQPEKLHREFISCQGVNSPRCTLVMHAQQEFETLNAERENNPELFGEHILQAQEALANLKMKLRDAQQTKSTDMQKLQTDYAALDQRINVMLAIVSTTSPE